MFILLNGSHYDVFIHMKYIFIYFIPIPIFCCSPDELILLLNSSTLLYLLVYMFVCLFCGLVSSVRMAHRVVGEQLSIRKWAPFLPVAMLLKDLPLSLLATTTYL